MGVERLIFVGSTQPLAMALRDECARRSASITIGELDGATVLAGGASHSHADRHVPILVVLTWLDLLREPASVVARAWSRHVERLRASAGVGGQVTLCLVPYASYASPAGYRFEFPAALPSGAVSPDADELIEGVSGAFRDAGYDPRIVVTPMVSSTAVADSGGYPSFLNRFVGVARALSAEVRNKVPNYFDEYQLRLAGVGDLAPSFTSAPALAQCLLAICSGCGALPPEHHRFVHRVVPWSAVCSALAGRLQIPVSCDAGDDAPYALDQLFTELLLAPGGASDRAILCPLDDQRCEPMSALSEDEDVLERLCAAPLAPWESGYVDSTRDLSSIPYLRAKPLPRARGVSGQDTSDTSERRVYFAGGVGPAVLLVPAMATESAFYANLAAELLANHRVLMWQHYPDGNGGRSYRDELAACTDEIEALLRTERITDFHLVSWCSGVHVADHLVHVWAPRIKSVTLLNPDIQGNDVPTPHYRHLMEFLTRLDANRAYARHILTRAKSMILRSPTEDLSQYRAPDVSPLRNRSAGSQSTLGAFDDVERSLWFARVFLENRANASTLGEGLRRYSGRIMTVLGTQDPILDAGATKRRCLALGIDTLVTMLGGNHYMMSEYPATIARLLEQFIRAQHVETDVRGGVHGGRIHIEQFDRWQAMADAQ